MRALLLLATLALPAFSQGPVVLISIDGMRPDSLLEAGKHGSKLPHLTRILHDGAHASGVRGILPTVTYPSHTTLLTGVWPVKHGIYSNLTFDPFDRNLAGWYWYAEDIRVPTLWDAAANAGLVTGSISWPVSVGARNVRYLVPEFWRAPKSGEDGKLMRVLSTGGLLAEIEKKTSPYVNDLDEAEAGDRSRAHAATVIIGDKRAQFTTIHLAALDHLQHAGGPFSKESLAVLEETDGLVGEIEDAARRAFGTYTIAIVSDHGFARTDHSLNILEPFVKEGFITVAEKPAGPRTHRVASWTAFPKPDGGSAAVFLKDPNDAATRAKVKTLLDRLAADPANGIAAILSPQQITALGGNPHAAFWIDMRTNYSVVTTDGPQVSERKVGGTHGYAPSHPELLASFFIAGPEIRKGADLGEVDMRAIAPTLARVLRVPFTTADAPALDVFVKK